MYVRRKNCEYSRIKRSSRKPKPCDAFSNNFGSYLKLFLIWSTIMVLDFLMEFRFEYMWPCWLLIRTINDSFKYQGMSALHTRTPSFPPPEKTAQLASLVTTRWPIVEFSVGVGKIARYHCCLPRVRGLLHADRANLGPHLLPARSLVVALSLRQHLRVDRASVACRTSGARKRRDQMLFPRVVMAHEEDTYITVLRALLPGLINLTSKQRSPTSLTYLHPTRGGATAGPACRVRSPLKAKWEGRTSDAMKPMLRRHTWGGGGFARLNVFATPRLDNEPMADGRRNRRMQEGMQEACPCVCVHAVTAETLTAQCGGPRSPTLRPLLGLWGALDEAKWLLTRFEPRRITPVHSFHDLDYSTLLSTTTHLRATYFDKQTRSPIPQGVFTGLFVCLFFLERGVCVPTVAMCFLFLYVEVAVRLRDPKTIPLSVDLCRPFAAHCHPHALCLSPFRFFCVFIRGTTALTSVLSQVDLHHVIEFCISLLSIVQSDINCAAIRGDGAEMYLIHLTSVDGAAELLDMVVNSSFRGQPRHLGGSLHKFLVGKWGFSRSIPSLSPARRLSVSQATIERPNWRQNFTGHQTAIKTLFTNHVGELANGQLPAPSPPNAITGSLPVGATAPATTLAVTTASTTTSTTSVASTSSKSSRKQQQQQSLTAAKSTPSAANCDHSLEVKSAPNHANADRKFFGGYDGTDHNHHHTQQLKESGEYSPCCEAPAISSSSSSLSGQEVALDARLSSASSSGASKRSVATTTANTSTTSPPPPPAPPPPPPPSQCNAATPTTTVATSTTATGKAKTSDKSSRAGKDASVYRLEDELRKLRHERQSMLVTESELRAQVTQLTTLERTSRTETSQARQEVEHLQSKLATVTQRLQTERENLQVAEKKAAEEKRQRAALEVSLAAEKRARKEAELALKATSTAASFGTATTSTTSQPSTTPPSIGSKAATTKPAVVPVGANRAPAGIISRCTSEACAHRMHDLETQVKALSRELAMKEAQLIAASQSNRAASPPTCSSAYAIERQQKMLLKQQSSEQSHRIADLMLHLGDLEAENARLKATLKAEDKMKQELLAGYHTSLKEITELNSTLTRKEYQIVELNMRLDLMNPNGPYSYMLGAGVGADADGRGGGHQRAPTGYMNGVGGGGGGGYGESGGGGGGGAGSLFPPRSTDADFDFGGGGGWPTFPTTSASPSVVFSDHHHHQQQQQQHHHRLRSDSTSAVLNVLLNTREDKAPIHPPPPHLQRFDTGVVDLEAASNSLSPPEFLSKLRSQLAMAGSNIGSTQQPAPISPPSRDTVSGGGGGSEVLSDGPTRTSSGATAEAADSDPGGGGEVVGGSGTAGD
ncbi:unnamed protein product [Mesocestoides corti]|uniref:Macoilin n=2 Tax=Mesocestoides corti TaxID=53468 RepID=A0A158QTJ1_MESCO|nr:unnamed protein product [Mesocestoides corti]